MRNRTYISELLNDLPSGPPDEIGARQRGPIWPATWFDPVLSNERHGRWERAELRARFSGHAAKEVAAWLEQAARDIVDIDVTTAVDRLVEHMYPGSRRQADAVRNAQPDTSADHVEIDDASIATKTTEGPRHGG